MPVKIYASVNPRVNAIVTLLISHKKLGMFGRREDRLRIIERKIIAIQGKVFNCKI
jgi:hypothetical protein